MKTWMRSILVIGAVWVIAGGAAADVRVTLRASAAVGGDGRAVTVADVAEIDPPTTEEATRIAEVVVVPAGEVGRAGTVTIAQVRSAMDAAKVNWGRTSLRGASCMLNASAEGAKSTPAPRRVPKPGLGQITPQIVDVGAEDGGSVTTIRQAVSARLVELYGVDSRALRLAFDVGDEEFLSREIGATRVDVQPSGTGTSARTPVGIVVYEGDRITATRAIAVQALIERQVVTARVAIARGQVIGPDDVEVGKQWVGPNAKAPVSPEQAIGQVAARAIQSGASLTSGDVTAPVVCKRGDIVWVHALAGPLTVKAKCRAQGVARDGEMVQLKMDGSDKVFSARMSGPGRAVMVTAND